MFQLTWEEAKSLRSQFVTLNDTIDRKHERGTHAKYLSYAFTEQGIAMLSSILRSKNAIMVNIAIIRAFVKLQQILATHKELTYKLNDLEKKFECQDTEIKAVFDAIRQLMAKPEEEPKPTIGFHPKSP